MTNGNGSKRINWQPYVAAFGAVGTLLLGAYSFSESQQRDRIIEERNDHQRAICDSVNKVNDVLDTLIREAMSPRPTDEPDAMERRAGFKALALKEIAGARCYVRDVDTNKSFGTG